MKKSKLFFVIVLVAATVISCSKENRNDNGMDLIRNAKDVPVVGKTPSLPISDGDLDNPQDGTIPYIIPGENRGGNRTCAEVAAAFELVPNPFLCGEKVDYSGDDFASKFPSWLHVTVTDGTFVSFMMEECALINGKYYRVGAVIVKGSSAANVYYYPDGTFSDSGLASPLNASGGPAGLSNLTFCFIECKEELPELVIVLKTYIDAEIAEWAGTNGVGSEINSLHLGYLNYDFDGDNSFTLYANANTSLPVGTLAASDYIENDIHYLEVEITFYNENYLFNDSYLYVGTASGYDNYLVDLGGIMYSQFRSFPFFANEVTNVRTFKIPFSEITE